MNQTFFLHVRISCNKKKKRIDFDLLPEQQRLFGRRAVSHYSSLFVIRFPIAHDRKRERAKQIAQLKKGFFR